jgi:hypothetical protein
MTQLVEEVIRDVTAIHENPRNVVTDPAETCASLSARSTLRLSRVSAAPLSARRQAMYRRASGRLAETPSRLGQRGRRVSRRRHHRPAPGRSPVRPSPIRVRLGCSDPSPDLAQDGRAASPRRRACTPSSTETRVWSLLNLLDGDHQGRAVSSDSRLIAHRLFGSAVELRHVWHLQSYAHGPTRLGHDSKTKASGSRPSRPAMAIPSCRA